MISRKPRKEYSDNLFIGSIVNNLLTFRIVHHKLKENTFLVARSENLTT